ncbi:hypothetical protein LSAT2_001284, partial [Lamellibrachia satsuma]
MATKPLVLVLGDSHVYWLERFVASAEVDFAPGSFREGRDCRIAFKGYRGGTVTTMEKNRGLDRLLEAELPAVVVLSVAGNAIDTAASMGTLTTLESERQRARAAAALGRPPHGDIVEPIRAPGSSAAPPAAPAAPRAATRLWEADVERRLEATE